MLKAQPAPSHLYHYTDLNAVTSILRSGELWLTNVGFLNDRTEYTFGRDHLKSGLYKFVETVTEKMSGKKIGLDFKFIDALIDRPVYISSFCKKSDLLSQWRGYCPINGGYAIEFNGQELADCVVKDQDAKFLICDYDAENRVKYLDGALLEAIKILTIVMLEKKKDDIDYMLKQTNLLNGIVFSTLVFKHSSFSEESEVRLACQSTTRAKHFRVRGGLLLPYTKLKIDVNTISKIFVGPMVEQELAKKGLLQFLETLVADPDCELTKLPEIEFSNIPLRLL